MSNPTVDSICEIHGRKMGLGRKFADQLVIGTVQELQNDQLAFEHVFGTVTATGPGRLSRILTQQDAGSCTHSASAALEEHINAVYPPGCLPCKVRARLKEAYPDDHAYARWCLSALNAAGKVLYYSVRRQLGSTSAAGATLESRTHAVAAALAEFEQVIAGTSTVSAAYKALQPVVLRDSEQHNALHRPAQSEPEPEPGEREPAPELGLQRRSMREKNRPVRLGCTHHGRSGGAKRRKPRAVGRAASKRRKSDEDIDSGMSGEENGEPDDAGACGMTEWALAAAIDAAPDVAIARMEVARRSRHRRSGLSVAADAMRWSRWGKPRGLSSAGSGRRMCPRRQTASLTTTATG